MDVQVFLGFDRFEMKIVHKIRSGSMTKARNGMRDYPSRGPPLNGPKFQQAYGF